MVPGLAGLGPLVLHEAPALGAGLGGHLHEELLALGVGVGREVLAVHLGLERVHDHARGKIVDPEVVAVGQAHPGHLAQGVGLHGRREVLDPGPAAQDPAPLGQGQDVGDLLLGLAAAGLGPPVVHHALALAAGLDHLAEQGLALGVLELPQVPAVQLGVDGVHDHGRGGVHEPEVVAAVEAHGPDQGLELLQDRLPALAPGQPPGRDVAHLGGHGLDHALEPGHGLALHGLHVLGAVEGGLDHARGHAHEVFQLPLFPGHGLGPVEVDLVFRVRAHLPEEQAAQKRGSGRDGGHLDENEPVAQLHGHPPDDVQGKLTVSPVNGYR